MNYTHFEVAVAARYERKFIDIIVDDRYLYSMPANTCPTNVKEQS